MGSVIEALRIRQIVGKKIVVSGGRGLDIGLHRGGNRYTQALDLSTDSQVLHLDIAAHTFFKAVENTVSDAGLLGAAKVAHGIGGTDAADGRIVRANGTGAHIHQIVDNVVQAAVLPFKAAAGRSYGLQFFQIRSDGIPVLDKLIQIGNLNTLRL